jgi:hypothetical protein
MPTASEAQLVCRPPAAMGRSESSRSSSSIKASRRMPPAVAVRRELLLMGVPQTREAWSMLREVCPAGGRRVAGRRQQDKLLRLLL